MTTSIGRREFITLLGGAAGAWPLAARAQQAGTPVIGFLGSASPSGYTRSLAAFREALRDAGFVEGQNLRIEYRWADDHYERLPALAAELVGLPAAVIFAAGGGQTSLAAKAATATIPIVFQNGSDPVKLGLVTSLNRPGGNVTGVTSLTSELTPKRFALMSDLVPTAGVIGWMRNPVNPNAEAQTRDLEAAASALGRKIITVNVANDDDLNAAFDVLNQQGARGLVVSADPIFFNRRDRLVTLTARHAIPTIFAHPEVAEQGGLMSYASNRSDSYRQVGVYAGRILKGEKPGDLPVVQPTKFELVLNLKTAKSLGFDIPLKLLSIADVVIE